MNSSPPSHPVAPEPSAGETERRATESAAPLGKQARIAVALLALFALAALLWPRGGSSPSAAGGFLLDDQGRPAPLAPRLAPVTLVHFWASWCPPCREEIPSIRKLARDYAGRRDFAVLMIAVADSKENAHAFLGSDSAALLFDPQWDVAHRYGTDKIPETYLVVDGQVQQKFVGATNWDDPALRSRLDGLLRPSAHLASGATGQ
jgi:thiol-disulfide isomerase/thioredoxin